MSDEGEWLSLGEAARRAGFTRAATYGRVKRGSLPSRPRGNRGLEVRWSGQEDVTPDVSPTLVELTARAVRAEASEAVPKEQVADLRQRLDRATVELHHLRLP